MKTHGFALSFLAALVFGWVIFMAGLLAWGSQVDPVPGRMVVMFGPHVSKDQAFLRVLESDALVVGGGVFGRLWTVETSHAAFADSIRAKGALALWNADAFDWIFSSGCSGAGLGKPAQGA